MLYFLKSLLLYSHAFIGQTKYIVMITNEGSIKIVSFITPGAGVLVLGCGHISHLVKMHYFLKYLLYFYAIVLRDYGVAFLYQCWFSFILWWGCWYTNMSPYDKMSVWSLWYSGYRYVLWASFSLKKVVVQNYLICTRVDDIFLRTSVNN